MDCNCNRDPTKCQATIHLCLCQQASTFYDPKLKSYRDYESPRGFKHCKAVYHHCRCSEQGGTYECRRDAEHHLCVCTIRGEYGQKKCIAHTHSCVCKMYSSDSCLGADHTCVCMEGRVTTCLAGVHICSCSKISNEGKCKATGDNHICSYNINVKNCLANTHKCRCLGTSKNLQSHFIVQNVNNREQIILPNKNLGTDNMADFWKYEKNADRCRSNVHPCYCPSNSNCENAPHTCVCAKNPGRCKSLEKHVCVCTKFIGHCLLHKGKIY